MSNRYAKKNFQWRITHRLHWLVIDCIDYSSISLPSGKWHFHEGINISKTKNTLNATWMTFSDFIFIHLVLTAAVEVTESSLWRLLLNQTLTPLLSSLSLENSSSTPCGVYLDSLYMAWRAILWRSESFVLPLELVPWALLPFLIYKDIDQVHQNN